MPVTYKQTYPTSGWVAADYGLITMAFDPAMCVASSSSTALSPAGTIFTIRVPIRQRALVTNIVIYVETAGGTLTASQCGAALYNSAGTLLSNTAMTQSTTWNSTGTKVMPLNTAQDCAPGMYDVGIFYNGTTGPTLLRAKGTASLSPHNLGLTTTSLRYATADTGRTTTFPSTLGAKTATTGYCEWVGLS